MRRKLQPIKNLRKNVWDLNSEWVRRREANFQGYIACFTCGKQEHWKEMNAGHYIHRDSLDFEEININPQCVRCNKWLSGNSGVYAIKLIEVFGLKAFKNLEAKRCLIKKFNREELENLKKFYQKKLEKLK